MTREADQSEAQGSDNAVGYRRPPKAHQFKPGQSGNPRGRPRGTPTLEDLFFREAQSLVKLKRGGEVAHVTKMEVLVRRIFQLAIEGDLGAARLVLPLLGRDGDTDDKGASEAMERTDDEVIKRILMRHAHLLPKTENEG